MIERKHRPCKPTIKICKIRSIFRQNCLRVRRNLSRTNPAFAKQSQRPLCHVKRRPRTGIRTLDRFGCRDISTPIAAISMIEQDRQWFKARRGLPMCEIPATNHFAVMPFCKNGVMVVPDTHEDARFAGWPMVQGEHAVRFYAGAPLITPKAGGWERCVWPI